MTHLSQSAHLKRQRAHLKMQRDLLREKLKKSMEFILRPNCAGVWIAWAEDEDDFYVMPVTHKDMAKYTPTYSCIATRNEAEKAVKCSTHANHLIFRARALASHTADMIADDFTKFNTA